MRTELLVGALMCAGALGCGGGSVPSGRVASAQAAIRAAEEVGAARHPRARLQLQLAREQLADAHARITEGDYEHAERLLVRAEADAELALGLSREAAAEAQARAARQRARELEEAQR